MLDRVPAMGISALFPGHSLAYDVSLRALSQGYAATIHQAIERGQLDCYQDPYDGTWVSRTDLMELAGPGSDTDDPDGGCYIPSYAVINIPYFLK